jgi:hypothetical protein
MRLSKAEDEIAARISSQAVQIPATLAEFRDVADFFDNSRHRARFF